MPIRSARAVLGISLLVMVVGALSGCGGGMASPQNQATPAKPTFSPAGNTFTSAQVVTITAASGTSIYYTTNGYAPTTSSMLYTAPITVSSTTTIEAIAVDKNHQSSANASATYVITLVAATPTISPGSGTYTTAQSATITDATSGTTIYYTTDGSTPTASSTRYTGAIAVNSSITLQAIAIAVGYADSAVASVSYTINLSAAATPVISLPTGTYNAAQTATISDATPGATIYYTLNGDIPTTQSAAYSGAISIDATETLKTIAVGSGYSASAVSSATYTLDTISLQPGKVIWGTDGHRDKGGPYYYIPLVSSDGSESQVSDLQAVFGKTHIFYRAWDVIDSTNCPWCTNDLSNLRAAEVLPLLYVISYPIYDGDCDGITPGFANFANESAAYTWAYCAAAKVVQANPTNTFWVVGNEWTSTVQGPISTQISGDTNLAATWRTAASYPLYRGAMAGAVAAIRDNSSTAEIIAGANGGCGSLGFTVAIGEDLASYNGRNLVWDYTNLHWGYDVAAGSGGYNNCGLPSSFSGGKNAYQILAAVGKPVFVDEIDVSNGKLASNNQAAGNNMTSVMADLIAHSPASSTEEGVVAGLIYQLYQDSDTGKADYLLYTYLGDPATSATIAAQGTTVQEWLSGHTVAVPAFTPPAGTYSAGQSVVLSDSTKNAKIYYTTDGSMPTPNSFLYGGAIAVSENTTIEAFGALAGYADSSVVTSSYSIMAAKPSFSPAAGTYPPGQSISISDSTNGASIYYTVDGSQPTTSATLYAGPIQVGSNETINAIAAAPGYANSPNAAASYTIESQVATPTISPAPGTYSTAQSISMNDSTSNATIYYSTNGSAPTTSSTKYAGPFAISSSMTIQAIAVALGMVNSQIASASYVMQITTATLTLTATPNPQGVGMPVVVTANVAVTNSTASTAGTYNVVADGNTICSGTTNTSSGYSCSVSTLNQGSHSISAHYVGSYNGGLQASAGPITESVLKVTQAPTGTVFYTIPPSSTAQLFLYDSDANATILYTTNGAKPSCPNNGSVFQWNNGSGELISGGPGTVYAIACDATQMPSSLLSLAY